MTPTFYQPTSNRKPVNYLNNKDILKEIHLSKNTYCAYTSPLDSNYDVIINLDDGDIQKSLACALTPENIVTGKTAYAHRYYALTGEKIDLETIAIDDLVFRIMTSEHVPIVPKDQVGIVATVKERNSIEDLFDFELDETEPEEMTLPEELVEDDDLMNQRTIFPAFQHFRYNSATNEWRLVGKSHWVGDLDSGHFSQDHGQITKTLANMYVMICEKYSLKFNWRGYSYIDEMRASAKVQLSMVGLRFNEAKSNNPFAYFTAILHNSFCRVLHLEKRQQSIRDDLLEIYGLNPSFTRQMQD